MDPTTTFNNSAPFVQISGAQLNLPEYSGKGDDLSFERWFESCVDELRAFGFVNEEQSALLMIRQLRGNARQTFDTFKYDNPNEKIYSLANFKEILKNKFTDDSYDIKLRFKLLNLKQKGDISKYIDDEKNIFGNYSDMMDKDRIFYLMNNMKAPYLNILNKKNPKTYLEAINALIEKGDQINMNAAMGGKRISEDDMEIDNIEVVKPLEHVELNLLSIENGGKTFWVSVKETKQPFKFPLNTSQQSARVFLDNAKLCWNCGSKEHLRRDCKSPDNHRRRNRTYARNEDHQAIGSGKVVPRENRDTSAPTTPPKTLEIFPEVPETADITNDLFFNEDFSSDLDLKYLTATEDELADSNAEEFSRDKVSKKER
ncbi:hypothetical protein BB561_006739 [Smittium simulii]|uniref:CCHC-type domain-containing protein n=1 Tax=Smittium simulii TaxID=133385 RepID=A0A2T9Y1Z0_9FUNG|nr:hypothetical protein BB561_006739 [Smittium simulii]